MKARLFTYTAFLFFLLVQWYGIYFMLYNHPGALGLDDAASYIGQINYFREFPFTIPSLTGTNINKLLHPLLFGNLAAITGLSAEEMFHLNFYIGLGLMGLTLFQVFRKTDHSAVFIATAFVILAFYEGEGSYHGFSWVVPSFYAIMLFLLSKIALFHSRHPYLYGILLISALLLTHSSGLYLSLVLAAALLIHELLFKKNFRGIIPALVLLVIGVAIVTMAELLHHFNIISRSFTPSIESYKESYSAASSLTMRLTQAGNAILQTIQRYDFTKYFYGLYTPLVLFGVYHALKEKKHALISLFIAVLIGQLAISPFTPYAYRFFYPLEIVTWIVIAFGVSRILIALAKRYAGTPTPRAATTMNVLLLTLSVLFIYNAAHQKAGHTWYIKFYNPMFVEQSSLVTYLQKHHEKHIAVYNSASEQLACYYLGLEGARTAFDLTMAPNPSVIAQDPDKWLVIGENHKLYHAEQRGFRIIFPHNASLKLKTPELPPGQYALELADNGVSSAAVSRLLVNHPATHTDWSSTSYEVRHPEKDAYPPILLPWYWNGDTPWPLYKRPMHRSGLVRSSKRHTIRFDVPSSTDSVVLHNSGDTIYMTGTINLVNLDTGKTVHYDFYWGDEEVLKNNISLIANGKEFPLLWTDPQRAPGKEHLFKLGRNFKDVKAFSYVMNASALMH